MMPFFDAAQERARYHERRELLERQASLRLELGEGIRFQPETLASVEDQVVETLRAEGKTLATVSPEEAAEVRSSFEALSPRREDGAVSVAATLWFEFDASGREGRLAALRTLPEQLRVETSSGALRLPQVDRGAAPGDGRLPSVLALRFTLAEGEVPVALVSEHPGVPGRFPAPASWAHWIPGELPIPAR